MGAKHGTPLERFERYYIPEPNSGCWLWTGTTHPRGYGAISMHPGPPSPAHVLSYKLFKGEVPHGMMVRHTCDVRACVNPDHLLLGTALDNSGDAVRRGRHAKGESHGAAKLTEEHVRIIRMCTEPAKELADEFGVSDSTVVAIRKRRKWKHVT